MAGKPKSSWGGKRENAGRPNKIKPDYDEKFKKDIKKVLKKLEKHHNISFLEKIFSMAYDDNVQDTVKASLLKTYAEIFTVKKTEAKVDLEAPKEPGIYLPKEAQDPLEEKE